MKHKHHIIPKHRGGTDDPSNIVELSIEEHADAHRKLYEEDGNEFDKIAWNVLSGQMEFTEASHRAIREGASRGGKNSPTRYGQPGAPTFNYNFDLSEEEKIKFRKKVSDGMKKKVAEGWAPWVGRKHTEETKRKIGLANSVGSSWNKGIPATEKHKQNIRDGMKRAAAARAGLEPAMSGDTQ
jgi:hypothetical protein